MIAALLLAGCTFEPGRGFGSVDAASLDVAFVPGEARDLGDGAVLTNLGYTVRLDTFTLGLGDTRLLELRGAGGATFDPTDPPEGYGLCHGGHCHRDDGALVAYADIEAELAGGGATFAAVATLPVEADVDALAGASLPLPVPAEDLPAADVSKVEIDLVHVVLTGTVSDDTGWSAPLSVTLDVGGPLAAGLDLPVDRDHDPALAVALALEPGGTLFDDLDLAALATEAGVVLDDPTDPGAEALLGALLAIEPTVTVTRSPW